jgi:prepilin-type N-terminal cleavage/methylation domain-containing protein
MTRAAEPNVRRAHCAGFTLVEVLVASVAAGVILAAAWGWLWTVAAPARSLQQDAQATSAAAFALRSITRELQQSTGLLAPTACAADRGLLVEHHGLTTALETVPIVWDQGRGVLWRKTSSTYLADGVSRFVVTYYDALGSPLAAAAPGERLHVARVHIEIALDAGDGDTVRAHVDMALRPA